MTRSPAAAGPWPRVLACLVFALGLPSHAAAQTEFMIRGFADVGAATFAAERSFDAVLGSDRGPVFGGGVEVVMPQRVSVSLRASRFRRTGQRVFVFDGRSFDLGIPVTVSVIPLQLTGSYRFDRGWRLVPFAGGGIGWHRYRETSAFAQDDENVSDVFRGFHLVGGAEVRLVRWAAAAVEAEWATVPDALGQDANGTSLAFGESNLGGSTIRVKIVIGR